MSNNVYFSVDIEADGPSPLINSMLSLGIVVFDNTGKEIDTFQKNIKPLENHKQDQKCMIEFWNKQPEAWEFVNTYTVIAYQAMSDLAQFYKSYIDNKKNVIWVAYPSAYDWQWINSYYNAFAPENSPDIGYSAKCISTLWWSYIKHNKFNEEQENKLWSELNENLPHTHKPVDDARSQGTAFINLCKLMNIKL